MLSDEEAVDAIEQLEVTEEVAKVEAEKKWLLNTSYLPNPYYSPSLTVTPHPTTPTAKMHKQMAERNHNNQKAPLKTWEKPVVHPSHTEHRNFNAESGSRTVSLQHLNE
jgi:hypothetical protein